MPPLLTLAVIIVNWNRRTQLRDLLSDFQHQTQPADELIVIDNGSTDGSPEMIEQEYPGVRLIRLKRNMGLSFGRNVGIEACSSELLMFPDNDVRILDTNFVGRARDSARLHSDCGLIGFQLLQPVERNAAFHSTADVLTWSQLESIARKGETPTPIRSFYTPSFAGGACLVRRSTFEKAGMFDSSLWYGGEEIDFAFRCLGQDILFIRDTGLWVVHNRSPEMRPLFRGNVALMHEAMMSVRHMPVPDLLCDLAYRFARCFITGGSPRGILQRLRAIWSGLAPILRRTGGMRRSPCSRFTMARYYRLSISEPAHLPGSELCTVGPLRYWLLRAKRWFQGKNAQVAYFIADER